MIDRSLNYGRHHIAKFLTREKSSSKILDLGAGHGKDLMTARRILPEAQLLAVESWPPYIEELKSLGVSVFGLNIERDALPFEDESVDVVIANQILEHTKELFWIFHEVSRALRVGGKFIVGVPNLASLHNRILLACGRQPSSLKSASAHVRGFTKRDLTHFAESCFPKGYELINFGGGNFYPFPPFLARPLASAFPNFAWGIFLCLRKTRSYHNDFLKFPRDNQLETNFWLGSAAVLENGETAVENKR
jgi:SAM-dependent methyltransferase